MKMMTAALLSILVVMTMSCGETRPIEEPATAGAGGTLVAQTYDSGFELSHDTYNGMGAASDGKIYYVLCSEDLDTGGQMYSFDPATETITHLGDLTEMSGEKGLKAVPQGKSHVPFTEHDGKLYFATHVGYYSIIDGMEKMPVPPPEGYAAYPGGHFLAYDMSTGETEDLAVAPGGEGILTMAADGPRGRLYGLTWPTGRFLRYDIGGDDLKDFGPVSKKGEEGTGEDYRTICRSLVVDPRDGSVYYTTGDGWIFRYRVETDSIEKVEGEDLRKDYFGVYDPTSPGHMGYNWRQAFWREDDNAIYAVHGNSGYLFRFDPDGPKVEVLERLTSEPSKRSGMFDQFSYGYLGFGLGPDGKTIYYLTGAPIYVDGKRVKGKETTAAGEAKGKEYLHLVTYDIEAGEYRDHGAAFYEDGNWPSWVNSIAIGSDGTVYTLARVEGRGDLVRIGSRGQ